ncbi:DUF5906 domain-containing protein [Endozoicomonas sp. 4G]|uniref:DUF5906 domain-containing protein n=1 Tax=Endozoicomonas sp. 4G TaxID=2872754 RepID=UPI002078789F|nr:DUF5906 domain-containing protein [Endozoicomonas sp. 4G]
MSDKTTPKSRAVEAKDIKQPECEPQTPQHLMQAGGKKLSLAEVERLKEFNQYYTHTVLSGKHFIALKRYSAVNGKLVITFDPLPQFKNYFLADPEVAGMNPGKAWLCWPGKNFMPGGVTFQPNVEACPKDVFNMWQGFDVTAEEGDVGTFTHHVRQVLCGGDEEVSRYFIQWLAHMLQKPDVRPSVAILLKSVEGTGKGTMVRPLAEILGPHFVQLNGDSLLTGRFNSIVANRLLVFADEVQLTDQKVADTLKAMISEPTVSMERKNIDAEPMPNFARFIFASNHDHVLLAGQRERRYLVIEPDAKYAQNQAHFNQFYSWLNQGGGASKLLHYLLHLDINDFNPHKAPVTRGLIAEKLQSMKPVQQWCYEWLEKAATVDPLPARIDGKDLAGKYRDWAKLNMHMDILQRAAETEVGNLMKAMQISKKRPDPKGPRLYQLAEAKEMCKRFAGILGHSEDEVFSEL